MNRVLRVGVMVALVAAVAAALGWWAWPSRGGAPGEPPDGSPPPTTASGKRGASSPDGAAQAVLSVSVTSPEAEDWPVAVATSGSLTAWQEAVIGAETGSLRLTELLVDVGATVRQGQILARLSSDTPQADVEKKEALVAQAVASLAQAEANARRARSIRSSGALSEQQINDYLISERTARAALASAQADLDTARITLARTEIRAVDDGIITQRSANLGMVVSVGTELFRLLRQGRVEWRAEVDATQLPLIAPGQRAYVTLPGGRLVTGVVRMAAPTLDSQTSRALVYISLPPDSGARVGSFASGEIEIGSRTALTLPQTAVVLRDGRSYAFTVDAEGRVDRHLLTTGRRRDDRIEILSGLQPGLRVVAAGGAFLSEGARVRVVDPPSPTTPGATPGAGPGATPGATPGAGPGDAS